LPDLADVREAIADSLEADVTGWQVSPYQLADPTPPSLMVMLGPVAYDQSGDEEGIDEVLTVRAVVSLAGGDIGAQKKLDELAGNTVIKDAIEATSLPLGVDDIWVSERTGMVEFVTATAGPYIGADWTVKLIWS
jgi:hypothetical protein